MDRAWTASSLDRCPVCGSYIVYADLRRKEKVFYCGTVTQEDKIVRPCSKQGDGEPWNEPTEQNEAFGRAILERNAAFAREARLRRVLERIEWIGSNGGRMCPLCRRLELHGHALDCELAAVLADR